MSVRLKTSVLIGYVFAYNRNAQARAGIFSFTSILFLYYAYSYIGL